MTSAGRERGVLSHSDFFYIFGQSLFLFWEMGRRPGGIKFLYLQAKRLKGLHICSAGSFSWTLWSVHVYRNYHSTLKHFKIGTRGLHYVQTCANDTEIQYNNESRNHRLFLD